MAGSLIPNELIGGLWEALRNSPTMPWTSGHPSKATNARGGVATFDGQNSNEHISAAYQCYSAALIN